MIKREAKSSRFFLSEPRAYRVRSLFIEAGVRGLELYYTKLF